MFQKGTFSKSILVWEAFSTFLISIYKITLYVLINQAHIRLMKKNKSDKTPEELCDPLLEAALNHVAFDGWSKRTLSQAEKDVGTVPGIIELAFPGGAIQMIDLHAQHCDIEMVEKAAKVDVNKLKIREKITQLVKLRIETMLPYKEATHRTVSYLALPKNHFTSLRLLYRTVDLIWKTIGDTSTDFNFYTKRITLSSIYTSTFLYWLADESEASRDTWTFLDLSLIHI